MQPSNYNCMALLGSTFPSRERSLKRFVGAVAEFVFGLDESVDFVGAFVDHRASAIAEVPLYGELIYEAIGTVDFDGIVGGIEGIFAVDPLGHAHFASVALAGVFHPTDFVVKQSADVSSRRHFRDHLLDKLFLADLLVADFALVAVLVAGVQTGGDDADGSGGDGVAPVV